MSEDNGSLIDFFTRKVISSSKFKTPKGKSVAAFLEALKVFTKEKDIEKIYVVTIDKKGHSTISYTAHMSNSLGDVAITAIALREITQDMESMVLYDDTGDDEDKV